MTEKDGFVSRLTVDLPGQDRFWFTVDAYDNTHFNVERAVVGSDRYDKIFAVLLTAVTHNKRVRFEDVNLSVEWILIYP